MYGVYCSFLGVFSTFQGSSNLPHLEIDRICQLSDTNMTIETQMPEAHLSLHFPRYLWIVHSCSDCTNMAQNVVQWRWGWTSVTFHMITQLRINVIITAVQEVVMCVCVFLSVSPVLGWFVAVRCPLTLLDKIVGIGLSCLKFGQTSLLRVVIQQWSFGCISIPTTRKRKSP